MKKTKHAAGAKAGAASHMSADERDDALADKLVELALDLREADVYKMLPEALKKAQAELRRTIGKCLQQQREAALDEALERAFDEDAGAYRTLREHVEEHAGTIVLHRDAGHELEVNAFVVPLFVHTTGGLAAEQDFQDSTAFDRLRESFTESGLESRQASVVLVAHAYHLDEIERIGFCQLHAMVHEAADAMTRKKTANANAIAASLCGWPVSGFAPDDRVTELRFLLGFALKPLDDPFYRIPEREDAADRYFDARAARFRAWSQQATPLLQRCLATDGRDVQVDFLYQDLFHGGKEAALRELAMLELLSEARQMLDAHALEPEDADAIIGPLEAEDDMVLRVSLHIAVSGAAIGVIDKPLGRTETVESRIADIADGLAALGLTKLQLARRFDMDGQPAGLRPYRPR